MAEGPTRVARQLWEKEPSLWPHQARTLTQLRNAGESPCSYVANFCGTGKSRIIRERVNDFLSDFRIVVLPSSALAAQFAEDYDGPSPVYILNTDTSIHANTTKGNEDQLKKLSEFFRRGGSGVVAANVQSTHHLVGLIGAGTCPPISLLCLDEAHHYTPNSKAWWPNIQVLMGHAHRTNLFSATPTSGQRREYAGTRMTEFTYHDALGQEIVKEFEMVVDVCPKGHLAGRLSATLARTTKKYGCKRVLVFHRFSNDGSTRTGTSVDGLDVAEVRDAFAADGRRVEVYKITGDTCAYERARIFGMFKASDEDDVVSVISNCRVIQEGVDFA